MASNTNIQVANLDFASIKQNFISYLQSSTNPNANTFKDYNFAGSNMSTLLDILAYNTQYNAFYLNMVANEMFLDSALQRSSVVSHAKLLNYVPQSAIGPVGVVNVTLTNVTTPSITIPKYTNFLGESINGVNYNFVTLTSATTSVTSNTATFNNIELKQGVVQNFTFTVNSSVNPKYIFEIPDPNVDTSTLQVVVQQSNSNTSSQVYNLSTDYLSLGPTDTVYFLQEATNGNYQVYFGDGVLGNQLSDGNIVKLTYVSTSGTAGAYSNNFVLMDSIAGSNNSIVTPVQAASLGKDKESIDSIKFQAPKAFAAQGRAVSKNDYITAIQQNNLGIQFDAVSVWGGEENDPPVYGQVFVSLKPAGAYDLTQTQKQLILEQVVKPISVLTVTPVIVDPDYIFIQINANVIFQQSQTTLTPSDIENAVQTSIYNYASTYLNTFNSDFNPYEVYTAINNANPSITSSNFDINLQKKFYPTLGTAVTYNLYYNTELKRGLYGSSLFSSPDMTIIDPSSSGNTISGVYIEEVPDSTSGVDTVSIITAGYNYTQTPTVVINGDGTGATAVATIVNGSLYAITVTNPGVGYTSAIATIVPATGDTSGQGATVVVNLQGRYGTLRSYYNDPVKGKVVVGSNVGTIDYMNGVVTLNNIIITQINNPLNELTISVAPKSNILSSTYNRILSVDVYDPAAINVTATAKRS